jgi:transaldolase
MLRLYIDTADREAAEPLLATGLFHGLTTNPTLLHRQSLRSGNLPELYGWATAAGAREVFFQAWGDDADDILRSAKALQDIGPDVVVKVPASLPGVSAAMRLVAQGHPVLLTAVYNAAQGLVAAAAGARYVAPYLGRMDDTGKDGTAEVLAMHRAITAVGSETKVLVASIRDLDIVVALAQQGVSCFALAPGVAQHLFDEPLTAEAVEVFETAARQVAR